MAEPGTLQFGLLNSVTFKSSKPLKFISFKSEILEKRELVVLERKHLKMSAFQGTDVATKDRKSVV